MRGETAVQISLALDGLLRTAHSALHTVYLTPIALPQCGWCQSIARNCPAIWQRNPLFPVGPWPGD